MNSFSLSVLGVSLTVLMVLLGYTLFLLRTRRISPHLAVRWILTEGIVITAVLLWGRLPLLKYTTQIGDRALLVILAVVFFGFVVYLILECLVQISIHTNQIKRLTQEVALLRAELQNNDPVVLMDSNVDAAAPTVPAASTQKTKPSRLAIVCGIWICLCMGLYFYLGHPNFPGWLTAFFTAQYKE